MTDSSFSHLVSTLLTHVASAQSPSPSPQIMVEQHDLSESIFDEIDIEISSLKSTLNNLKQQGFCEQINWTVPYAQETQDNYYRRVVMENASAFENFIEKLQLLANHPSQSEVPTKISVSLFKMVFEHLAVSDCLSDLIQQAFKITRRQFPELFKFLLTFHTRSEHINNLIKELNNELFSLTSDARIIKSIFSFNSHEVFKQKMFLYEAKEDLDSKKILTQKLDCFIELSPITRALLEEKLDVFNLACQQFPNHLENALHELNELIGYLSKNCFLDIAYHHVEPLKYNVKLTILFLRFSKLYVL